MIDTSGQRIRGKLDPFKKELDPILTNVVTDDGFELFREYLKDAVALRMRHTMYAPIEITNDSINIIKKYTKNTCVFSFIRCSLKYYCNKKNHKIRELDTSCSCCKSKDHHKSLQHAKQDCLECGKHYMRDIKKQLSICNDINMLNNCVDVEKAIKFVCEYICAMHEGTLPKTLKCSTYYDVYKKDKSIEGIYSYNEYGDYYYLTQKKASYNSISLVAATEIFCSCYTF
mgnify:CR=1 FL=1